MDSFAPSAPNAPAWSPRVPGWALPRARDINETDAAFGAGIALKSLDDLIRADPPWLGCWRDRLALKSAAVAVKIRACSAPTRGAAALSEFEAMVLMAVGYFQPVTRGELSKVFGKEVSRDVIGNLRGAGFIGSGPRSPTPVAPYTYVTTNHFLSAFGLNSLRDLPDIEALEDEGRLSSKSIQVVDPASTGDDEDE